MWYARPVRTSMRSILTDKGDTLGSLHTWGAVWMREEHVDVFAVRDLTPEAATHLDHNARIELMANLQKWQMMQRLQAMAQG